MAISLGDIFAQGIIGGVAGAGQAAYQSALEEQKQQSEALKEQRLSQLRIAEHASETQSDIVAKKGAADAQAAQNASFYARTAAAVPGTGIIDQARGTYDTDEGPGTTESNTTTTTIPPSRADVAAARLEEAKKTGRPDLINQTYAEAKDLRADADSKRKSDQEDLRLQHEQDRQPYYQAQARKADAEASDIEENGRLSKKLPARPSIVEEKDASGNVTGAIDRFSGARMRIIPGTPEVKAETHLFGADVAGKPATPAREVWTMGDRVLPGGISDLYPQLGAKSASAPDAPAMKPAAATAKAPPPATLPLPGGKGNGRFTGRFSAAGHPLYQDASGALFEGR